ncbi:MAG: DUF5049 domain-containing protein [Candidatus Moranbacteria bacterium]|nr:DUF5049 domain-containing protein [Candidatus Moranbacteria bacterium]
MITEDQFKAFLTVRDSGVTNMFDIPAVVKYAKKMTGVKLSKENCLEIIRDFMQLGYKFGKSAK